jgi:SEC-C motif-containing protein
MILQCPCGSGNTFSACCEPFIQRLTYPSTAEQLMRSRFSAYATGAIDYLIETTHSSTRKRFSRKDIEDWSRSNKWLKLEVLKTTESTVEFKAYYVHGLSPIQVHHERSNFKKEDGRWYYVDAY